MKQVRPLQVVAAGVCVMAILACGYVASLALGVDMPAEPHHAAGACLVMVGVAAIGFHLRGGSARGTAPGWAPVPMLGTGRPGTPHHHLTWELCVIRT